MAKLDKSQGFTFVYSDLHQIHKQVLKRERLDSALAVGRKEAFLQPMGVIEAEEKALRKRIGALEDPLSSLRQNLNTLTKAHAKLRFLLQEIDTLTKKPSGRKQ